MTSCLRSPHMKRMLINERFHRSSNTKHPQLHSLRYISCHSLSSKSWYAIRQVACPSYFLNSYKKVTSYRNSVSDQCFPLTFADNDEPLYNSIVKLGTLDHIEILCLTHTDPCHEFMAISRSSIRLSTPPIDLVRRLFIAYRHAFFNYSEQFILYYLYRREQISSTYSITDLMEIVME